MQESSCALWQAGVEQFDELHEIDWDWLSMEGAMSHPPRRAGEKTGRNPTDRGKSGVRRSVLTKGHSVHIAVEIEGANRHDMRIDSPDSREDCRRTARTQPMAKPQGMCLDKGYDYDEVRTTLKEFGFTAHIKLSRPCSFCFVV